MTTPHKWADVIKAWADGKPIQFTNRFTKGWVDWTEGRPNMQPQFNQDLWRVKPNTIKYRRYVAVEEGSIFSVQSYMQLNNEDKPQAYFEQCEDFVRWIDTEWQEVEV